MTAPYDISTDYDNKQTEMHNKKGDIFQDSGVLINLLFLILILILIKLSGVLSGGRQRRDHAQIFFSCAVRAVHH